MPLRHSVLSAVLVVSACASALAAYSQPARSAPAAGSAGQTASVPEGCHAFDFEYGRWKMPNDRLVKRLAGSHQWDHFMTYDVGKPLPGCIGGIDIMKTSYWPNFVGVTIRTYDPKTGLWRIYWVDNRFSGGEIQPPVVGKFNGNVGVFYGKDTYNGIPVLVRFIWTVNPKGSKVVATWSQASSRDGGKTWETNWRNELVPDDH
jgi:hypothetical protein